MDVKPNKRLKRGKEPETENENEEEGMLFRIVKRGWNREVNLPSPYFLSQFLPPPYFLSQFLPPP